VNPRPATTRSYETDEARWQAVQARDANADGHFVYAVRTTGIYCRPSASAKLPRRESVEFFASASAAEAAGYRPSRRAKSDRTTVLAAHAALIQQACHLIESTTSPPTLDALAARIGMSPSHLHRLFKAETGMTPKTYATATRARKLRDALNTADGTVTDAIYDAGFNANSRFYETSDQILGMRARQYRAGGLGVVIRFAVAQCSLGAILVARSQRGICAILLGDDPDRLTRDLQDQFPQGRTDRRRCGF